MKKRTDVEVPEEGRNAEILPYTAVPLEEKSKTIRANQNGLGRSIPTYSMANIVPIL